MSTFQIRIPVQLKAALEEKAARRGLRYREYLEAVLREALVDRYQPEPLPVVKHTRLDVDDELRAALNAAAKSCGRSPEDYALAVLEREAGRSA